MLAVRNCSEVIMKRLNSKSGCAVEVTLSVMGGTWKPVILFHLLPGKKRFGELGRIIGGITQRMLTLQLRELEEAGIVERTVYAEVPPRGLCADRAGPQPAAGADCHAQLGHRIQQELCQAEPMHDADQSSASCLQTKQKQA
jgi:DNA-binding transcriptional ArsR family regulator